MRKVSLTQGYFAKVDDEDYEKVIQYSWQICRRHGNYYANSTRKDPRTGTHRTLPMHRLIMNLDWGDGKVVDHINHNGLDNTKSNLRICTKKQNLHNRKPKSYGKSKYLGVYFDKEVGKWRAATRGGDGETKCIGSFESETLAALAYNQAAEIYYKNFSNLNKILETEDRLRQIVEILSKINKKRGSPRSLLQRELLLNHIKSKINAKQ